MADVKRDGLQLTDQGAVYVHLLSSTDALPSGAQPYSGTQFHPRGKWVTADGALIVSLQ